MSKLSRLSSIVPLAEARIDEYFAARIDKVLGPMAALHARKRVMVNAGLMEDDGVTARAGEQDTEILAIDTMRRDYKARVRAALTSTEIKTIVDEALGVTP